MNLLEFNKHIILKDYTERRYASGYLLHLSTQVMFQERNLSPDSAVHVTGL